MKRFLRILLIVLFLTAPAAEAAGTAAKAGTEQTRSSKSKSKSRQKTTPKKKAATGQSAPKTSADAKKRRRQTEQQMARTAKELKAAEAELTSNLRKVSKLESDIERSTRTSALLKARIDSISAEARLVKDSIAAGEAELERLRGLYTRAVRSSRKNRREMNTLTFIFSAETFRQAWRRMRYLEEFSGWRKRKTEEISLIIKSLEAQKASLEAMKVKLQNLRRESLAEERRLRTDKASLATAVGNLQGRQKELNTMLQRQKSALEKLDREIERLIQKEIEEQRRREEEAARHRAAEEARRKAAEEQAAAAGKTPADKPKPAAPKPAGKPESDFKPGATAANSPGNFAAQKGRLPSPLSHTYIVVQGFGVQHHRSIKTLEVNNPGVDLETAANATARAVYPGTVSAVFMQEGLNHVVLIRHGEYLTVYANVKSLRVKKGDKLKTGDIIGTVGPSDVNPVRGQLHFEIRREREKFNPLQWLKR